MNVLRICLFGRFRVSYADKPTEIKMTPSARTLLAFLTLQAHRFYPRDILIDLGWGEHPEEQAHACLNTALWRLRRMLARDDEHQAFFVVTTPLGEVGFNWESAHWIDLVHFEMCTNRLLMIPPPAMQPAHVEELTNTLTLYTGDLLEGFYDEWALRERERIYQRYLKCLVQLMNYYQSQFCYEKSIFYGQKILHLDPLREEIHREIMRLYQTTGHRSLALRQYQICCEALDTELAIGPMEETQALYQQIVAGVIPSVQPISPASKLPEPLGQQGGEPLANALQRLDSAFHNLEVAREDLRLAMQLVEHCKNAL